jgi:hypothetical protein
VQLDVIRGLQALFRGVLNVKKPIPRSVIGLD